MHFVYCVLAACAFLVYVNSDACVQCHSAKDPRCATQPENFMAMECANSSICYTRVDNGDTIRGCASELDNATRSKCNNELQCLICSFAEGCNRNVFPRHRARCLQCEGNVTGDCALDLNARPMVCPIYRLGDRCYVRNNGKNVTDNAFARGCLSTAQSKNKCVKDGNCYVCDGFGCNNLNVDNVNIPLARDSAATMGYSFIILTAGALVARFF